ncbi:VirK/YbjX family protein [Erwinia persicina]|uniref:VirK/YbjX family protein n=1 Tax=Erwinia persicina TaxID=55211 RepID=UPI002104B8AE|nr:VirK/YbjX family protein [Erwinia persicina]MCQ4104572.1 VirK/YbjX family protein [Erwinia persicina]UTX12620.1 VirK/YbjX family protein [Erwinia persicina]
MSETLVIPRHTDGLSLFLALLNGGVIPGAIWEKPSWRAKFLARSLAWPLASAQHMQQIASRPTMRQALDLQPMLPGKIHRPYLYLGLSAAQRGALLSQHYDFLQQLTHPGLRNAMLSAQPTELASFTGKEGEQFQITLTCNGRCEREGEVNMLLHSDGTVLAILTFAVTDHQGLPMLVIGGIQGASSSTPHERIRAATKSCYGLFPKRVLMEGLSLLARATGISAIRAVSDRGHTYRSLRYRFKKKDVFLASYDEFWQSLNAERVSPALWQLPLVFSQKSMDEIPSKKRAEYRRRYELLEVIRQQFARFH